MKSVQRATRLDFNLPPRTFSDVSNYYLFVTDVTVHLSGKLAFTTKVLCLKQLNNLTTPSQPGNHLCMCGRPFLLNCFRMQMVACFMLSYKFFGLSLQSLVSRYPKGFLTLFNFHGPCQPFIAVDQTKSFFYIWVCVVPLLSLGARSQWYLRETLPGL